MISRQKISQGHPACLPDMEEAALESLRSDRALRGENVVKFEEEFAKYVGTDFAVSTSSGTNALQFILLALEAKGKKIVTSTFSFIASSNAIIQAGATPVFGDITMDDYCLDPSEAEKQVRNGAAGVMPVHIFGLPADMDGFQELSQKHDVPIIEDACQSHGASYGGKMAGNLGTAAAFSFYPSKNMTVLGDGGMVTTNDQRLAESVSKLRDCGRTSWYEHDVLGYTSRLNSVNAAIGRVQLRHLEEWNARRRQIAEQYARSLKSLPIEVPPMGSKKVQHVFHQFVIRAKDRDGLKAHLDHNGIETGIHYPIPIHLQPLYKAMFNYRSGAYPRSELLSSECLSLPMHTFLSDDDVKYICGAIAEFYGRTTSTGHTHR